MSTNSMIGILNDDNKTVTAIYCHWDGYISNNGYLLSAFWKDKQKAEALIKVGSISGLGTMLPVRDGLVAEMADRTGIIFADPRVYITRITRYGTPERAKKYSLGDFKDIEAYNYCYVPKEQKWYCYTRVYNSAEIVCVDCQRYFADAKYFMEMQVRIYGAQDVERHKAKYVKEWKNNAAYAHWMESCMKGTYNVMHNVCDELNRHFGVAKDAFTGAVVETDGKKVYVIYDALRQGQKRRKRLAEADTPLLCVAKAYDILTRMQNNRKSILGKEQV